jgi:hypothetical protein
MQRSFLALRASKNRQVLERGWAESQPQHIKLPCAYDSSCNRRLYLLLRLVFDTAALRGGVRMHPVPMRGQITS